MAEVVCVTGANGCIGSWIVRLLLAKGYRVRASVQNLEDDDETKHLEALEGAQEQLQLFQADLLDYEALATVINGSVGVFHVASPCILEKLEDPQRMVMDPAVKGTLNVLKASHNAKVKRVVVTSSISSMVPNPKLPPGVVVDENCWTDEEFCRENGVWYPLSKTVAERTAWEFAKETNLDVVCINPGCVLGEILPPRLNASALLLLNLLKGDSNPMENAWLGCVHVKDVAEAHILLYETPSANGRYLCTEGITHFSDFAKQVSEMYPQYKVHRFEKETHPGLVRCANPSKKLESLGFTMRSSEEAIRDAVSCMQKRGLI